MCKALQVSPPPAAAVRHYLCSKGFKVSQSHTDPQAIKTDADPQLVWDILHVWADKVGSASKKRKVEGNRPSVAQRILRKPVTLVDPDEIDFSVKRDKFVRRGQSTDKGVRFPLNPEPNWGPKARAGKRKKDESMQLPVQNE
ncbi:tRNA methyltransferase Trm1 [Gracilaria domingensis]|nr:tRNA methyltransferase Trm1 [Gracilaria domingensis]